MVEAFIFDLDGVITNTAELHFKAWKHLAEEIGITIDQEFNEQLKGMSRLDSLNAILTHGGMQNTMTETEKITFAMQKNNYYKKLITEITPDDILPNIKSLLKQLSEGKYKIALASASENAPAIIARLELEHFFPVIANPKSVEQGKPAPDIFLLAANQLKVNPSRCIGIEDAISGVEAIQRANMFAVGIGTNDDLQIADYLVSNTNDLSLPDVLKQWEKWYDAK